MLRRLTCARLGRDSPTNAIAREKELKKWRRAWKLELIEKMNPEWIDLYDSICR
jgi:putative endonuclease